MLLHRFLSSLVLLPLVVLLIVYGSGIGAIGLFILANVIVALGVLEFIDFFEAKQFRIQKMEAISVCVFFNSILFVAAYFEGKIAPFVESSLTFLFIALIPLFYKLRRNNSSVLLNYAVTLASMFYVVWLFSFNYRILYMPIVEGWRYLLFVVLVTKSSDIVAYCTGMMIGKTKLAPTVSPGKTIEGTAGAIAGALCVGLVLRPFIVPSMGILASGALGILFGMVGQMGDLIESILKRDAKEKDSGKVVPGMGGVLDLIDSVLVTAPIMYLYLRCLVLP